MGLNLGRQEKPRRSLVHRGRVLTFLALALLSIFVLNATANAEEEPSISFCDRSELVKNELKMRTGVTCSFLDIYPYYAHGLLFYLHGLEEIRSFKAGDFANMPNLQALSFDFHQSYSSEILDNGPLFVRNIFAGISSRAHVSLGISRDVTEIPKGFFDHFSHIKSLEISMWGLKAIKRADFSGLVDVEKIVIHSDQIELIEDNAFADLKNFQTLEFKGISRFSRTQRAAFTGVPNLKGLPANFDLKSKAGEAATWD